MPDRIEAGTFASVYYGCSGNIILTNTNKSIYKHLKNIKTNKIIRNQRIK